MHASVFNGGKMHKNILSGDRDCNKIKYGNFETREYIENCENIGEFKGKFYFNFFEFLIIRNVAQLNLLN